MPASARPLPTGEPQGPRYRIATLSAGPASPSGRRGQGRASFCVRGCACAVELGGSGISRSAAETSQRSCSSDSAHNAVASATTRSRLRPTSDTARRSVRSRAARRSPTGAPDDAPDACCSGAADAAATAADTAATAAAASSCSRLQRAHAPPAAERKRPVRACGGIATGGAQVDAAAAAVISAKRDGAEAAQAAHAA